MSADLRPVPTDDPNADLGFGSVVSRDSRKRLLNRDGTFNVRREGLGYWEALSAYHYFLTISWPKFLGYVAAAYVVLNALFAVAFVACGAGALTGFSNEAPMERFTRAFFFSVHTLATIGYGNIVPVTFAANVMVALESLVGLLGFSIIAGIMFARFARPRAEIAFSEVAVIAPYRDKTALMFRIVNKKRNEIVEMEAKVLLARRRRGGQATDRDFIPLKLERERVVFFPLAWTIVHPIDETSPLSGCSPNDLRALDAELLILLNGFDETFSQTVHTRSSYKADEIVWGARFRNMFNPLDPDGTVSVDIRKLHEVEPVA
ncbi:MAG: transporter [Acidobacteria bacterium]|nr:transporter [Acidobacteriota bacterium]MBV9071893.1 transporter [Acidobacteriota bacterium]MBV9188294.1 transporter [Acidobacteriota bacterium]